MIKAIQKLKHKKAFTLVEVIIVLVILAILAAVMIPSLTGYIDRANESSVVGEARDCLVAAQTAISEYYASGNLVKYLNGDLPGMSKGKTNKYGVPKLDEEGNPVKDKKGNIEYEYVSAGRISNSTFRTIQYNSGLKDDNQGDTLMGRQILKYLESESKDPKKSRYVFVTADMRLGKNGDARYRTAENFFKNNPKDNVALNIYYDFKTGKVIMIHFAKRGYDKIIEMYPSGKYSIIDEVSVMDK